MDKTIIKQMLSELKPETSGGGTHGVYQDIVDKTGEVILKGIRSSTDRIAYIGNNLSGSLLDIGCNLGSFCHYYQMQGVECTGIDINPVFIKWAKAINPKVIYHCLDMDRDPLWHPIFNRKYTTVLFLAVFDYFRYPEKIAEQLKSLTGRILYFEGHADGPIRIDSDISEKGRLYKSWNYILDNVLKVKHEFLGFTDNGRRPFWRCSYDNA